MYEEEATTKLLNYHSTKRPFFPKTCLPILVPFLDQQHLILFTHFRKVFIRIFGNDAIDPIFTYPHEMEIESGQHPTTFWVLGNGQFGSGGQIPRNDLLGFARLKIIISKLPGDYPTMSELEYQIIIPNAKYLVSLGLQFGIFSPTEIRQFQNEIVLPKLQKLELSLWEDLASLERLICPVLQELDMCFMSFSFCRRKQNRDKCSNFLQKHSRQISRLTLHAEWFELHNMRDIGLSGFYCLKNLSELLVYNIHSIKSQAEGNKLTWPDLDIQMTREEFLTLSSSITFQLDGNVPKRLRGREGILEISQTLKTLRESTKLQTITFMERDAFALGSKMFVRKQTIYHLVPRDNETIYYSDSDS